MKILVLGANGPTGRLFTRQAARDGHDVTAFTRRPGTFPSIAGAVRVLGGDVHEPNAVTSAVAGQDAVVSILGVPFSQDEISVYSHGVSNVLDAMTSHGVDRLLCVSSSTMAPHPDQEGGFVFRKVMQPYVVNRLGRTLYDDMRRMEDLVRRSDVDWTIVRPSGLFAAGTITDYVVAPDSIPGRFTGREDLADCLLREIQERAFVRDAMAVATTTVQPSMLQLIWREGIRKTS